jgi:hypothetical protein
LISKDEERLTYHGLRLLLKQKAKQAKLNIKCGISRFFRIAISSFEANAFPSVNLNSAPSGGVASPPETYSNVKQYQVQAQSLLFCNTR